MVEFISTNRNSASTEDQGLSVPVCYSDNNFVNSSPDCQHFIGEQKEKSFEIL